MGSMRAQNFVGRMDGSEKTAQRMSGFHPKQREECNQSIPEDEVSITGLGGSPGEGNGRLQYS